MLIDPNRNVVIEGSRFDLTPEDVIKFCGQRGERMKQRTI
jgi:hypothetical protein